MKEYRVVWKRKDMDKKTKLYKTMRGVDRFVTLLGDEPWKAFNLEPDDTFCCNGYMCACGGVTVREHFLQARENIPPLEWIRLEEREVGNWILFNQSMTMNYGTATER